LSQWVTKATREAKARKSAPPATGKTGYWALMTFSNSVQLVTAPKSLLAPPRTTRNPHPISLEPKYIALRGLISETNVFNLIDQKR
jgi:hypothetical protein